jgi:hypothetical protein
MIIEMEVSSGKLINKYLCHAVLMTIFAIRENVTYKSVKVHILTAISRAS